MPHKMKSKRPIASCVERSIQIREELQKSSRKSMPHMMFLKMSKREQHMINTECRDCSKAQQICNKLKGLATFLICLEEKVGVSSNNSRESGQRGHQK